jgi:hypothetical protein
MSVAKIWMRGASGLVAQLLAREDGQGIGFLARRAAGHPDAHGRYPRRALR